MGDLSSGKPSGFLRLPTELRLQIFKYYYLPRDPQFTYQNAGSVLLTPPDTIPGPRIKGGKGNTIFFTNRFASTPLLICRTSYPEAFEALYTANIFTFSEQLHSSSFRFTQKLTEPAKAMIKHIRIVFQPQEPAQTNHWYQLVVNGKGRAGRASIRCALRDLAKDLQPRRVEFWFVYEGLTMSPKSDQHLLMQYAGKFRHIEGIELDILKAGSDWNSKFKYGKLWDEVFDAVRSRIEKGDWPDDDD